MKIKNISIILSFFLLSISCNSQSVQTVAPQAFNEKLESSKDAVVLDVRTPEEFESGHLQNAKNVDFRNANFKTEVATLDKSKTYFVYCLAGSRSANAAGYMQSIGFKNVINLEGGMMAWQKNNLPVENTTVTTDAISMEAFKNMLQTDTLVLVDYYAPWCAPCIKMKPALENLSKEYEGKLKVIRLNIDENKNLATSLNITTIPVLQLYQNGKEIWNHQGYLDKAGIEKEIKDKLTTK